MRLCVTDKTHFMILTFPSLISPSLNLLTASMDKTMIVWAPPVYGRDGTNEDDQLWSECVRLGDVGGNTLGFIGAQFDPSEKRNAVIGYSFSGAFHCWREESSGGWQSTVQLGGHSDRAVDIDWAAGGGEYLLSAGADQTTRVHAPWKPEGSKSAVWRECARPQVHGHDLACLCSMPGHRLSSGSEEKVLRVFEATASFLDNLESICGRAVSSSEEKARLAQGASVPSLGLSNKAVLEGATVIPEMERHVKDQYPDHYFKPEA